MIAPFRLQAGDRVPVQQTTHDVWVGVSDGRAHARQPGLRAVDPRSVCDKDAKDDDVPDAAHGRAAFRRPRAGRRPTHQRAGRCGRPHPVPLAAGSRHPAVGRHRRARVRRRGALGGLRHRVVPIRPEQHPRASPTRPSSGECATADPRCSTSATPGCPATSCSSCRPTRGAGARRLRAVHRAGRRPAEGRVRRASPPDGGLGRAVGRRLGRRPCLTSRGAVQLPWRGGSLRNRKIPRDRPPKPTTYAAGPASSPPPRSVSARRATAGAARAATRIQRSHRRSVRVENSPAGGVVADRAAAE